MVERNILIEKEKDGILGVDDEQSIKDFIDFAFEEINKNDIENRTDNSNQKTTHSTNAKEY